MRLGNIWKDFTANSMKKGGLISYAQNFLVDYDIIDVNDIINIHN